MQSILTQQQKTLVVVSSRPGQQTEEQRLKKNHILSGSGFLSHWPDLDHTDGRQLSGVRTAVTLSHVDLSLALGKGKMFFPMTILDELTVKRFPSA